MIIFSSTFQAKIPRKRRSYKITKLMNDDTDDNDSNNDRKLSPPYQSLVTSMSSQEVSAQNTDVQNVKK